jgi:hypothetical protein
MPIARIATTEDLAALLDLFRVSDVSATVEPIERAEQIWRQTMSHHGATIFVAVAWAKIAATSMLITAPLRSGQGHAFLENAVCHPAFQGQGHARAIV